MSVGRGLGIDLHGGVDSLRGSYMGAGAFCDVSTLGDGDRACLEIWR